EELRFGLLGIKTVGENVVEAILRARAEQGSFRDLFDFCERVPVRTVSLLLNLGLVGSIGFASVYLNAAILPYHIAGAGFILIGSVLMEIESLTGGKWHFAHLKHKHRSHV
ncbi:MAG: hypothetical protein AAB855_00915, partial [Patescibacteria group bacterium]